MFKFLKKLIKWTFIAFILFTSLVIVISLTVEPMTPEEKAAYEQSQIDRAAERAERDAAREAERVARMQEESAAEDARLRQLAEEKAEERRKGFHCLSVWNGSHTGVVNYTKTQLREPGSFEHIATRVLPVSVNGTHQLVMTYRARNGFGGMTVGIVKAEYSNSTCQATVKSIE